MRHGGFALLAVVVGGLALLGWALGHTAAVAVVLATGTVAFIGARECRVSVGDVVRRKVEMSLGSSSVAPGCTLVAVACPDQLEHLPGLLASASATSERLVVLAIEPLAGSKLVLPRAPPDLLREQRPRVRDAIAAALARVGPVTFMTASGRDLAAVTLDVARRIAAREVLALCIDSGAAEEDARHAASVWRDLPTPKAALSVRLLLTSGGRGDRRVQLAADPPPIAG